MSILLDSGMLIAYHRQSDEHHARAKLLLNELSEKKTATLLTSHVLEEIVTFLSAKDGAKKAFEVGHRLLNTKNVDVV